MNSNRFIILVSLLLTSSIAAGFAWGVSAGVAVFTGLLLLKNDVIIKIR